MEYKMHSARVDLFSKSFSWQTFETFIYLMAAVYLIYHSSCFIADNTSDSCYKMLQFSLKLHNKIYSHLILSEPDAFPSSNFFNVKYPISTLDELIYINIKGNPLASFACTLPQLRLRPHPHLQGRLHTRTLY